MSLVRLAVDVVRPARRLWVATSFLAVAAAAMNATVPLLARLLFDTVLAQRSLRLLAWFAAAQIALMLLSLCINVVSQYMTTKMAQTMQNALQARVYDRILRLPLADTKARAAGDLMSVVNNDAERVTHLAQTMAVGFVRDGLAAVVSLVMIFAHNRVLGAVALLSVPAFFASFFLFRRRLEEAGKVFPAEQGKVSKVLQEGITNVRLVKAFQAEARQTALLSDALARASAALLRLTFLQAVSSTSSPTLAVAGSTLMTIGGAYYVIQGQLSVGTMLAVSGWFGYLFGPVNNFALFAINFAGTKGAAQRVIDVLQRAPEDSDRTRSARGEPAGFDLRLESVTFRYGRMRLRS